MAGTDALSAAQISAFREQGFLVLEDAATPEQRAQLLQAIQRLQGAFDPSAHQSVFSTGDEDRGRDEVFFRSAERIEYFLEEDALDSSGTLTRPLDQAINKLGHALHDLDPTLGDFARQPLFAHALRDLGLQAPTLWQSMVIFKQPEIGGAVRWHQDASYLYTDPSSVVGAWLALEDATRENGCLLVQPGGHRSPLRERYRVDWNARSGRLETLDATPWPAADEGVALEVPAGSLVLFHDHLPHASAANRSSRRRTALTFHFADARSHWAEDNWLQRPTLPAFRL
jgi:phytanoyl-CoA hydroxylase